MKDPFGNYVVQKVLESCDDHSLELILSRIRVHLNSLKRYTYGKHIVSRVEKLITTGGEPSFPILITLDFFHSVVALQLIIMLHLFFVCRKENWTVFIFFFVPFLEQFARLQQVSILLPSSKRITFHFLQVRAVTERKYLKSDLSADRLTVNL